ncbi:MAG: carboxypeptidase-like regulatory domain-containing protein [Thermoproteota archaeon]|nr:carboxypeptidase-like regulatory domain-containing protein [Thermoproteota archaeon]
MAAHSKETNGRSSSFARRHVLLIIFGAIVAAILIGGFLFSGGTTPSSNNLGSMFTPLPVYKSGMGAINGYVSGPFGLPAVGTSVIAAQQGGKGITSNAVISIDGKYVFGNLPPGEYIIMVAYPNGVNKVLNHVIVDAGSIQTINIKY